MQDELERDANHFVRTRAIDEMTFTELAVILSNRLQGIKKNIDLMNELLKKYGLKIGEL